MVDRGHGSATYPVIVRGRTMSDPAALHIRPGECPDYCAAVYR